jgi:hypothetical protein
MNELTHSLARARSLSLSLPPRLSREVSKDSEQNVCLEAGRSPRRTRRDSVHESARPRAGGGGGGTGDVVESEGADGRPVRGLAARRVKPESSI